MKRSPLQRKSSLRAKPKSNSKEILTSWTEKKLLARSTLKRSSRIAPRSRKNKKRPRNIPYMLWIKTLPCAVCRRMGSEAAHTGPRGLGQKSPDEQCIPLCPDHHRHRKDALDVAGPRNFTTIHHIDIPRLVEQLNIRWEAIRIDTAQGVADEGIAKTKKVGYV